MVSALGYLLVPAVRRGRGMRELPLAPWRADCAASGPYQPGDAGGINSPGPRRSAGMTSAKPESRRGRRQVCRDQPASERAAVPLMASTPITLPPQSTVDLVPLSWGQARRIADRLNAESTAGWPYSWTARVDALACGVPFSLVMPPASPGRAPRGRYSKSTHTNDSRQESTGD